MLGIVAAVAVIGAWIAWFWLANRVRIPRNRMGFLLANALGAILGLAAVMAGGGVVSGLGGGVALFGGATFLALSAFSGQAKVKPAVSVGSKILEFSAPDESGRSFELASLRGKPFLLKFFRGHW